MRKALLLLLIAASAHAEDRVWDFEVRLDGTPIGSHRFTLSEQGEERVLLSKASFTVKFLGFTAYRYQHEDTERWRGDCVASMDADTNDDGKPSRVQAEAQGPGLRIRVNGQAMPAAGGCLMSFAYWNPALLAQAPTQLLNSQTGRIESVRIRREAEGQVEVRGKLQAARRWRITGVDAPIDLWVSPQGEWLALDSQVRGGRQLQYRLR